MKNFSQENEGKFFVEAKMKEDVLSKERPISIRDICVNKDLYTIPFVTGDDKYKIERYYSSEIESIYPEVYKKLINPKVIDITIAEKREIILTTMSLFFRTPKFLNFGIDKINKIFQYAVLNHSDKNGFVKFNHKAIKLDFHLDEIENERQRFKLNFKLEFLKNHLKDLHDFVEFKINADISVFHLYENDVDLISSDNPVTMHSIIGNEFKVFDPTNIIQLPLDNKHFLLIFQNEKNESVNKILRGERDKWFAITSNLEVDRKSEQWIFGKPNSISAHIIDQENYGKYSPENIEYYEKFKEQTIDMFKIYESAIINGIYSQKTADVINELRRKNIHQDNRDLKIYAERLTEKGFQIL